MARQTRRPPDDGGSGEHLSPQVAVALEEYRALREEIIASLGMQQTVLSFSTLALGGLALAGFHELAPSGNSPLALLIFLLVLPLVSYVSLFIWLGEFARTTRAGSFLSGLEQRINGWVGAETLTWERYLRTPVEGKRPQYVWNVRAIFSFYALVPVVAVVVATLAGGFASWRGWRFTRPSSLRGSRSSAGSCAASCGRRSTRARAARRSGGAARWRRPGPARPPGPGASPRPRSAARRLGARRRRSSTGSAPPGPGGSARAATTPHTTSSCSNLRRARIEARLRHLRRAVSISSQRHGSGWCCAQ